MREQLEQQLNKLLKLSSLKPKTIRRMIWKYLYHKKMMNIEKLEESCDKIICGDYSTLTEMDLKNIVEMMEVSNHES